ncbi:MAG: efflux RND transporter permease subunit, partial [Bacteroidales bacterium]
MKIIKYFLQNRAFTLLLLAFIIIGGIFSYMKMGKLEDAPFTIKQALVLTTYPGATPEEVQTQVTDILEESIQSLGELYYLKTENRTGLSKITVYVKKEIRAAEMQQLWDKLRRKVSDVQSKLPAGAGPSVVNDDFGDVLGVFYSISSENYSYRQLEDKAKELKKILLNVKDVAKVELYGIQAPTIDIKINPSVMVQSGLTTQDIAYAFEKQNKIVDAGGIETATMRLRIEPTGSFSNLEEIANLTIVSKSGEYFKLSEIADITESYAKPTRNLMRVNNKPAVGIAVSTVPTGNVVDMAALVKTEIEDYKTKLPQGITISNIYDQGYESQVANDGFILNLIISVITVVAILLFFIGFKNGILVGSGLIFSILGTLIYMYANGIALQRMSLAAIIIAMGMLVDNAIVVTDSALINMQKGMRKRVAIMQAATSTAIPLLAATMIAILTFWPVYMSPHVSGELLSSLFIVLAVSLFLSWVFALIQTPFCIEMFVRRPRPEEVKSEMFNTPVYNKFRALLRWIIKHKIAMTGSCIVLLGLSIASFKFIPKVFLPQLDKQYFSIDMWTPEGTRIEHTDEITQSIVAYMENSGIEADVSAYVGQTPPRYYLGNSNFGPQPNFAQLLIKTPDTKKSRALQAMLKDSLAYNFPDLFIKVNKFEMGTLPQALIEARFLGPDAQVLDSLTEKALAIMRANPKVIDARNEWEGQKLTIEPV